MRVIFPSPMNGKCRIDAQDKTGAVHAYLRKGALEVVAYGGYWSWGYSPTYYYGAAAHKRAAEAGITQEVIAQLESR
jgi:hypothetical protein